VILVTWLHHPFEGGGGGGGAEELEVENLDLPLPLSLSALFMSQSSAIILDSTSRATSSICAKEVALLSLNRRQKLGSKELS
jgi:hypothetical protein